MPFANIKNIFEDLFGSLLFQLKKYHPSGNLKYSKLGISQSLKFRILMEKILLISLKLFTADTLGGQGFSQPAAKSTSVPK